MLLLPPITDVSSSFARHFVPITPTCEVSTRILQRTGQHTHTVMEGNSVIKYAYLLHTSNRSRSIMDSNCQHSPLPPLQHHHSSKCSMHTFGQIIIITVLRVKFYTYMCQSSHLMAACYKNTIRTTTI